MANLSAYLIVSSAACGLAYWLLGVAAAAHLKDPAARASDRLIGAAFYWSFESSRYAPKGVQLCAWGNAVFVLAVASLVAWAFYK